MPFSIKAILKKCDRYILKRHTNVESFFTIPMNFRQIIRLSNVGIFKKL